MSPPTDTSPAPPAVAAPSRPGPESRATGAATGGADPRLAELGRRAGTLFERLQAAAPRPHDAAQVEQLLAPWSRVVGRGDPERLRRRLRWDGIRPETAAAALDPEAGVPADSLVWLRTFHDAIAIGRERGAESLAASARQRLGPEVDEVAFAPLWLPWVEAARTRLRLRTGDLSGLFSDPALADLERALLRQLARCGELAALERLELLRRTAPERAAERFVAAGLHDPATVLFEARPVLARQLAMRVDCWVHASVALAERYRADRIRLAELLDAPTLGPVAGIAASLSDPHDGGRTVCRLRFASGERVFYKPRSVAAEAFFERFVAWCRDRGLPDPPAAIRVLERPGYGWASCAEPANLPADQAENWFRRAGSLLAIAHLLRGRDLHAENLVATTEGPAVVDAEMLLQPVARSLTSGETEVADEPGDAGDVLATGLLGQVREDGSLDVDLGGLRVARPRGTRRVWEGLGSDAPSVRAEAFVGEPLPNCPRIDGRSVGADEHADAVARGFAAAARFLVDRHGELLAADGPLAGAADVEVRFLVRSSEDYGRVLRLAEQPRNQRSGLAAGWLSEALLSPWTEGDAAPVRWPLGGAERRALERGDVPRFTVRAGAVDVAVGRRRLEAVFALSGAAAVRQRLEAWDDGASRRQEDLVRRALAPPPTHPFLAAAPGRGPAGELSRWLAAELRDDRLPTAPDLAAGLPGIALVLTAAARTDPGLAADRDRAIDRIVASPGAARDDHPSEAPLPGGHSGLGSTVWALCRIHSLLPDPRLLDAARTLARWLAEPATDEFDLDRGAAGAILGLLCLARTTDDPDPLDRARAWGERLLGSQRPTGSGAAAWPNAGGLVQPGLAHGAAGAIRALGALGAATGESRFLVAAAAAIAHERGCFDARRGNWPVLLSDGRALVDRRYLVAACRGAPGIALSRLFLPPALVDPALGAELGTALATTATAEPGRLDTLCCGTLGRASVLWTAARLLPDARVGPEDRAETLAEAARRLTRGVLDRAADAGAFGLGGGAAGRLLPPRPGLLKGLAGVAWHLLRLEDPDLPEVLALELPGEPWGDSA